MVVDYLADWSELADDGSGPTVGRADTGAEDLTIHRVGLLL